MTRTAGTRARGGARTALAVALALSITSVHGDPAQAAPRAEPQTSATSGAKAWPFLPLSGTRAREFVEAHPAWDGRGVVIAVLDTGVDPGLPGLSLTSEGLPKLLDCRDFSGQGTVPLEKAERDTTTAGRWRAPDGTRLDGIGRWALAARDSTYWVGFLTEGAQRNSEVPDLNGDGETGDRFAIVAFETAHGDSSFWVAVVDTDDDGDLGEERPIRDYDVARDTFVLDPSPHRDVRHPLTFALHIDGDAHLVSVHFDDGSHGSHVAGIAAGFRLNGVDGMNGVAPGAQLLSLKIGNNTLSGGTTTTGSMEKALEFVGQWTKEHHRPVMIDMSYGIGNAWEGRAAIDSIFTDFLLAHPQVAAAGNEGPGLSTAGTPGSCPLVVTSGAWVGPEEGKPLFGADLLPREGVLLHFSSRGGELAKPDVVSPGSASSSVPPFATEDLYWGTSMASPQTAGALALLASACLAEKRPVIAAYLKEALRRGATPVTGATVLDQGAGLVQAGAAWAWLRANLAAATKPVLAGFRVNTASASIPDGGATAVYWRTSEAEPPPGAAKRQRVTIAPLFYTDVPKDERARFYEAFDFRTDAPWLRLDRSQSYVRGSSPADFSVSVRTDRLPGPGLAAAAEPDRPGRAPSRSFAFRALFGLPSSVQADGVLDRFVRTTESTIENADKVRIPVDVDASVKAVELRVALSPETYGLLTDAALNLLDPEGKAVTRDGMGAPEATLTWNVPDTLATSRPYTLEIWAAFAREEDRRAWQVRVTESSILRETVSLDVHTRGDGGGDLLRLTPGFARDVQIEAAARPPAPPHGYALAGFLTLRDSQGGRELARLPVVWDPPSR